MGMTILRRCIHAEMPGLFSQLNLVKQQRRRNDGCGKRDLTVACDYTRRIRPEKAQGFRKRPQLSRAAG
jgi:hypothetical protein